MFQKRGQVHRRIFFFLVLLSSSLIFAATTGLTGLYNALSLLCSNLTAILPVAGMLMVVVSALIYGLGQILGMESRARANVYATSALTGAFIAFLITAIAPTVFSGIYGSNVTCGALIAGPSVCGICSGYSSFYHCCSAGSFHWLCRATEICYSGPNLCLTTVGSLVFASQFCT